MSRRKLDNPNKRKPFNISLSQNEAEALINITEYYKTPASQIIGKFALKHWKHIQKQEEKKNNIETAQNKAYNNTEIKPQNNADILTLKNTQNNEEIKPQNNAYTEAQKTAEIQEKTPWD